MKPKIELINQWLTKADDDLRMAELVLNSDEPVYWGAAFHSQQAAEKLLKALLTYHGIDFEKTHDIDYLLEICCDVEPEAETLRLTATKLTDFAVESRYPLPHRDPTEAESKEAVEIAHQIRRFVHEKLPQK